MMRRLVTRAVRCSAAHDRAPVTARAARGRDASHAARPHGVALAGIAWAKLDHRILRRRAQRGGPLAARHRNYRHL